jgi:hypothetical protein
LSSIARAVFLANEQADNPPAPNAIFNFRAGGEGLLDCALSFDYFFSLQELAIELDCFSTRVHL